MRRGFARLVAVVSTIVVLILPSAAPVAGHEADEGGNCAGNYKLVVFEHANQAGANDDFCFWTFATTNIYTMGDPNFDSNDPSSGCCPYVPLDDIGNRYLMGCCVSSYSIRTTVDQDACLAFYSGTNYQNVLGTDFLYGSTNGHGHYNLPGIQNDRVRSIKFYMNYRDYMC